MKKRYYTLRFEYNDAIHTAGDQVMNADNAMHIGQTPSCEARLPNATQYEDAVYAVIEKREDDKGWKLVRTSPYKEHEVRVNGVPVNYVHLLSDGDRISFEGQRQELTFHIREDELYTSSGIVALSRKNNRPLIAWMTLISVGLIVFLLHYLYNRPMSPHMIKSAKASVYQIKVDSIQLVERLGDSTTVRKVAYHGPGFLEEFGTAFLCTDGSLVTARHCIEPWLNLSDGIVMDTVEESTPKPVKMALEAVTRNIIAESHHDSTRWEMVSYCSLRRPEDYGDSVFFRVKSNDFVMDNSRDHIIQYGDYSHLYFWRSMKVRPNRKDMMLGDIAYLPHDVPALHGRKGNIRMANKEELRDLCKTPNRTLSILGRTFNTTGNPVLELLEARLKSQLTQDNFKDGYPNTVIPHDGELQHGFSGGPVMTRQGFFRWCVIGVVSVSDTENSAWYYSVPISEIERMKERQ